MDWPGEDLVTGIPVVLPVRPSRNRERLGSEHFNRQAVYYKDSRGYLVPARGSGSSAHRSLSTSGHHGRNSPTQIIINNTQWEEHSPPRVARHERRRKSRSRSRSRSRSSSRSRSRSRVRHRTKHYHVDRSRTPSPRYTQQDLDRKVELDARLKKLEAFETRQEEDRRRQQYENELIIKAAEDAERKKKEDAMKRAAIEEHNQHQKEVAAREKAEREKAELAFQERVKTTFGKAGYSSESIERVLKEDGSKGKGEQKKIMDLARPTYIKVHRKHLSPDTLDAYDLPWEWDNVSIRFLSLDLLFGSFDSVSGCFGMKT